MKERVKPMNQQQAFFFNNFVAQRRHRQIPWTRFFLVTALMCLIGCPSETDDTTDGGESETQSDAGSDTTSDGGQNIDGGSEVSCVYEEANTLGDFSLSSGYSLVDTAIITLDYSALAIASHDGTDTVYGLDSKENQIVDLGTWAELVSAGSADHATPVFNLLREDDTSEIAFASQFLASNGRYLAAGYTLAYDANTGVAPGHIALFDTLSETTPNLPVHIPSDNNFHASFMDTTLLVNSGNLGGMGSSNGVYAWEAETSLALGQAASFPGDASASGFTVATAGDAIGLGFYNASYVNQMTVVSRADLMMAITEMQPLDLQDEETLPSPGFLAAGHMGDDLVLANGYYDSNFELVQEDVVAFPAEGLASDGGVMVNVGTEKTILDAPEDTCQRVIFLSAIENDLIVAVADEHPTHLRLLRISVD